MMQNYDWTCIVKAQIFICTAIFSNNLTIHTIFSFKQFTIQQDQCAMKVCTDSCLFGAWVANKIAKDNLPAATILDIGTGTGVLSLMLAQKINALIETVEIDADAALQAAQNFSVSPWKDRLQVFNVDALQFTPQKKYDLIITNPPFYKDDLRSPNKQKNNAKHEDTFSLTTLFETIEKNLHNNGYAAILLPWHRLAEAIEIAAAKYFYISYSAAVKQTPAHAYFRSMLIFTKKIMREIKEEIIITDAQRQYTPEFATLLKDYYLKEM